MMQRLCARTALAASKRSTVATATGTCRTAGFLTMTPSPRPFLRHLSAGGGDGGAGATSATPLPFLSPSLLLAARSPSAAAAAPLLRGRRCLSLSGPWRTRSRGPGQQPHKGAHDHDEAVGAPRPSSPSASSVSPPRGHPAATQSQGAARLPPASPPALAARENIYTIPNMLTASRLVAAPIIGYAILHDQHALALGLFAYAGLSDLLDGWIARRWNLGTVVGTIIDPMADKTLMLVLTLSLAAKGALPREFSDLSPWSLTSCSF
ncbi:phosphatidyl synthase [Gaeumannomyces tritici R3-111a-1]|uniref:Phosphatidyl synthase n=1 Tax=Gaeumannomyces tritici (strain R3-111a-1) TaxID=644352 RepID=J3NKF5_GAET3|nr:phosphatidyl synthase [Gaeumannomyces tritici R3-111a-1]EJT81769.1 phosphatidyl synthase [Gaeumannomyces tritici R3-111a-1]